MSSAVNRQILLVNRPIGEPKESDFSLVEVPIPEPGPGQFLARIIYLSLDPYMRGRMNAAASYAKPAELNQPMVGGTISQVVRSNHPDFHEGDLVLGHFGWQQYAASDGKGVRKIDPSLGPISYFLGILGMPGMTAYCALLDIGRPKAGETVVVSAASGAVGSVAGQIARIKGCRAVGIAGSDEKCTFVVSELGLDTCINYKTQDLAQALAQDCPAGIDVYFDNVAGPILEAVLRRINVGARIPLVGLISQYNAPKPPPGPNLAPLLVKRALIQGFLVGDHESQREQFLRGVSGWLKAGKLKYKEEVVQGLENAPRTFLGLFQGKNFGKLLVRVALIRPDPVGLEHGRPGGSEGTIPVADRVGPRDPLPIRVSIHINNLELHTLCCNNPHITVRIRSSSEVHLLSDHALQASTGYARRNLTEVLAEVARHYLDRAWKEAEGNKTEAARLVGLASYQTWSNWLTKYGVDV